MSIYTMRERIKSVPNRWYMQYKNYNRLANTVQNTGEKLSKDLIYQQLLELDTDTCSKEDVDNIIGNTSWTELICDECRQGKQKVFILNMESTEYPFYICHSCVQSISKKFYGAVK